MTEVCEAIEPEMPFRAENAPDPQKQGVPVPEHYVNLDAVVPAAWTFLAIGSANRRSGFHTANVATVRADGYPTSRTVVLRGFEKATRTLLFHTDARSRKFAEFFINPKIGMHFYDAQQKIQMRLDCIARVSTGDDLARARWVASREMSRVCYAQGVAPGSAITSPVEITSVPDAEAFQHFAVVSAQIVRLDWLYLAAQGHRRASFAWTHDGTMTQTWLAP